MRADSLTTRAAVRFRSIRWELFDLLSLRRVDVLDLLTLSYEQKRAC